MENLINEFLEEKGYRIIRKLGAGTYAKVLLAENGQAVVIKYPRPEIVKRTEGIAHIIYSHRVEHITNQSNNLEYLKGIEGVAQKIETFPIPIWIDHNQEEIRKRGPILNPIALVQQYIESSEEGETPIDFDSLFETIKGVHSRGLVLGSDDILWQNINVRRDGKPHFFDLGFSEKYEGSDNELFIRKIERNLRRFEEFKEENKGLKYLQKV